MKIKVDRHQEENELVFTIRCSEPHLAPFSGDEAVAMSILDDAFREINCSFNENNSLHCSIKNAFHGIQDELFQRLKTNIEFSIRNELEPKFIPMLQEIYNWIYEFQIGNTKSWMQKFDPQRCKYYFDNDRTIESDYD